MGKSNLGVVILNAIGAVTSVSMFSLFWILFSGGKFEGFKWKFYIKCIGDTSFLQNKQSQYCLLIVTSKIGEQIILKKYRSSQNKESAKHIIGIISFLLSCPDRKQNFGIIEREDELIYIGLNYTTKSENTIWKKLK